jgi:ARG/rhodanese/phosphatase superfamily protein
MRSAIGLLAVLATSSSVLADDARKQPTPDIKGLNDHAALLDPIQVDSLTLTPIVSTGKSADPGDLLVLDEAMPAHQVTITEFNEGDVNNLTLQNSSDKPVFLLAGEVIIGGKQDRIIGRNTIIPAKTKQQVPVYCVEHGRWEGTTKEFSTAKALAHGRLRARASFDNQSAVWAEVHSKNEMHKTTNSTDTYRKVATEQAAGGGSNKDWQARIDTAIAKLPAGDRDRMIGKIASVDMFGSPKLFKKLEKKLVASYVTEAVDIKAAKDIKPPTASDVKVFVFDADKAEGERSYDTDEAATVVNKGSHASKSGVRYKPSAKSAPADAKANPVYETYHSNQ